jgi:hypothetical protein
MLLDSQANAVFLNWCVVGVASVKYAAGYILNSLRL